MHLQHFHCDLCLCCLRYAGLFVSLSDAPLSAAFAAVGLQWAAVIIGIGAMVGIISVLLATLMGQPRILFAMARDGLLPPIFAEVHPTYGTPHKASIITGIFASLVGAFVPMTVLVELVNIGTLFAFVVVCISVIVLRYTRPDIPRPFRCPCFPFIPIAGALSCIMLMLALPVINWIRLMVWLAMGLIIYALYGRKHSKRAIATAAAAASLSGKGKDKDSDSDGDAAADEHGKTNGTSTHGHDAGNDSDDDSQPLLRNGTATASFIPSQSATPSSQSRRASFSAITSRPDAGAETDTDGNESDTSRHRPPADTVIRRTKADEVKPS